MIETILQIDHVLSLSINQFHSAQLDAVMIAISSRFIWIPFYMLLAFVLYRSLGWKTGLILLGCVLLNVVLCDQISVLMKDYFMRLRPCHNPEFAMYLFTPDGCGGQYGFVSSHAANTMGLAALLIPIIKKRWISLLLLVFAGVNGYSRVYLGKHYALDIAGGYMLGVTFAIGIFYLFQYIVKKTISDELD